ncbi:MAG: hypothetical protein V7703_15660 [Hyphomicrobiales bacterium]
MNRFDRFLAIDWSGAMGERQRGIQIAYVDAQTDTGPVLMRLPDGKNWGRVVIKNLLGKLARANKRTLVGMDFCFSVPWPDEGPLPEGHEQVETVEQLWEMVEAICSGEAHYYAGPAIRNLNSAFSPYILCDRYRGPEFRFDRFRETERQLSPKPASIYHCMGAKQVGPGSFAGMRMFHALRAVNDPRIAIWPFDPIENANVVLCEMYPSLFYQMAGLKRAYDQATIRNTLAYFHSGSPPPMSIQDEADAVIAAAALRAMSADQNLFSYPPRLESAHKEGWIFGVMPS